jgi:tRNA(fMet)-specific endonuclease VapC
LKYLLDTNICIYALNNRPPEVLEQLARHGPPRVAVSSVTVLELRHGAEKSQYRKRTHARLDAFLGPIEVLPFDEKAALEGARIRARLEKAGTPIGDLDSLIAATALALDLTLVSNNLREFERVDGLRCESWVDGG